MRCDKNKMLCRKAPIHRISIDSLVFKKYGIQISSIFLFKRQNTTKKTHREINVK